jgi:hypothetical protein
MTLTRRVYQKVFLAYITQTLCKIRHYGFVSTWSVKAKAFTRETSVKVLEKVEKNFLPNVLVAKQEFTSNSSI